MKIGLVGSGGREHAMARLLVKNKTRDSLHVFASHQNPGITPLTTTTVVGDLTDKNQIAAFFHSCDADIIVIGPETPLMHGVSDKLRSDGLRVVGPNREQAKLEGSKLFMRALLQKYDIPGSLHWCKATSIEEAVEFFSTVEDLVIKPVGLTGGKGVRVKGVHFSSQAEALGEIHPILEQDDEVLLEERLVGEEFSRMAFISDQVIATMPVAQDFKYAYDGDTGGMTGGMGSYTMPDGSLPFLCKTDINQADDIIHKTVSALQLETGEFYRGFLYGQFMATSSGVKVIEFNTRLGDPEAINMMSLIECDFPEILKDIADGNLHTDQIQFSPLASLCKYLVPTSYPQDNHQNIEFQLDENRVINAGMSVIFASVVQQGQKFKTLGSRVMAISGTGPNLFDLSSRMESVLAEIEPPTLRHRKDVGKEEVIQQKMERMRLIRESAR